MNSIDEFCNAVLQNKIDLVYEFLDIIDVNSFGRNGVTPLHAAIEANNEKIISILLNHGAKINLGDKLTNSTALHFAVDYSIDGIIQANGKPGDEPTNIINLLLENGANINFKNKNGETPIDWAISYKSEKIIKLLNAIR
jgi:ankyrin repeat protein